MYDIVWRYASRARVFRCEQRYAPDELVFGNSHGNALHPENFRQRVRVKALERAGLGEYDEQKRFRPLYRLHDCRHTAVSRLVAAGADIKLVQAVAGHANPVITLERYSHLLDARITEAAERFDPGALGPAI